MARNIGDKTRPQSDQQGTTVAQRPEHNIARTKHLTQIEDGNLRPAGILQDSPPSPLDIPCERSRTRL